MASHPGRRTRNGSVNQHPGMANYPADDPDYRRARRSPPMPSANRYLPPLGQEPESDRSSAPPRGPASGERITITRAAAQRSREMGSRMYWMVQRAATADGADKSGLTALTWPVVANFAVDSAMAVALANTLFFAAASGESKSKVALYLLITIAPFAV
ncbi:MAG TPA: MFS transporter, partial [Mycobacterium sp.]